MKYYSGKYKPRHPAKYDGDPSKIQFRSLWERQLMRWCDHQPSVKMWNSEEVVVPYISPVDLKYHRYFVDFKIDFINGKTFLIEVKPKAQTLPPTSTRKTKRMLQEVMTYSVNQAKWDAASAYADKTGMEFAVWTEDSLTALGIPLSVKRLPKLRRAKKNK